MKREGLKRALNRLYGNNNDIVTEKEVKRLFLELLHQKRKEK